jgi:ubiquinone/menaquinone biosynthesis C-methylase UbiE
MARSDFHRGFEDVDGSGTELSFFQFLDLADRLPSIAKYRNRMLELCPVTDGCLVLDVGCGIGNETTRVAHRIGKTGRVTGLDSSEAIIDEARCRAGGLDAPVHFEVGDVHSLAFDDASFDVCRAERVFIYLENPTKAMEEMARVTRPGGHVIVFDFDHLAFFIDSDFAPMTRHIEVLLASAPRNPSIGREIPHLMRGAKLQIEAIEQMTLAPTLAIARRIYAASLLKGIEAHLFTAADVEAWWQEQDAREQDGTLYHTHPGYLVAALKP